MTYLFFNKNYTNKNILNQVVYSLFQEMKQARIYYYYLITIHLPFIIISLLTFDI